MIQKLLLISSLAFSLSHQLVPPTDEVKFSANRNVLRSDEKVDRKSFRNGESTFWINESETKCCKEEMLDFELSPDKGFNPTESESGNDGKIVVDKDGNLYRLCSLEKNLMALDSTAFRPDTRQSSFASPSELPEKKDLVTGFNPVDPDYLKPLFPQLPGPGQHFSDGNRATRFNGVDPDYFKPLFPTIPGSDLPFPVTHDEMSGFLPLDQRRSEQQGLLMRHLQHCHRSHLAQQDKENSQIAYKRIDPIVIPVLIQPEVRLG